MEQNQSQTITEENDVTSPDEPAAADESVAAEEPAAQPAKKSRRRKKIAWISVASAVGALLLVVIGYFLYIIIDYERLPDVMELSVSSNRTEELLPSGEHTIVTYNVGFGAYSPDYTFFMDTGVMKNGFRTTGEHGKGKSKADVQKNTDGSKALVEQLDADFVILQEVDFGSDRSYDIDQRAAFKSIPGYGSTFAVNYHSSYLFYPFSDPIGKSNSGILTLSKYNIADSRRYAFPIDTGLSKFTDLDRCFSITHVPVGDKTLSIISLHMSAYDEGGKIRRKQAEKLKQALLDEYNNGANYVIAGGDFNHNLLFKPDGSGDLERFPSAQRVPDWVASFDKSFLPAGFSIAADETATVGSCRGADVPWIRDWTYTCMIDGFIVSDNIRIKQVKVIDNDFAFSDHNPVKLTFEFV